MSFYHIPNKNSMTQAHQIKRINMQLELSHNYAARQQGHAMPYSS